MSILVGACRHMGGIPVEAAGSIRDIPQQDRLSERPGVREVAGGWTFVLAGVDPLLMESGRIRNRSFRSCCVGKLRVRQQGFALETAQQHPVRPNEQRVVAFG